MHAPIYMPATMARGKSLDVTFGKMKAFDDKGGLEAVHVPREPVELCDQYRRFGLA